MRRVLFLLAGVFAGALPLQAGTLPGALVPTYQATYRIEYKGKRAGQSQVSVLYDAEKQAYRFSSSFELEGLFKLAAQSLPSTWSEFKVEGDGVMPLRSWVGGVKGKPDALVEYDWTSNIARSDSFGTLAIEPGTLDIGTMRVALMGLLRADEEAGKHAVIDGGEIKNFEYATVGTEAIDSTFGELDTYVVVEQQAESSRKTLLWMAPTMCFLPVRISQEVDGKVDTSMVLESVEGIALGSAECGA